MSWRMVSLLVVIALLLAGTSNSATITGTIVDEITGSPLPGVQVQQENSNQQAVTADDGHFSLNVPADTEAQLVIRAVGYELRKVNLSSSADTRQIRLTPIYLPGQDIIVTGTRARRRETPVAFTNVPQQEIEESYWAQDVPMLLTETPGVYAYSDNGLGNGYSYLSVRGFPQSRVAVLVNGVPHNDPLTQQVYWVDMPDFLESVEDIQIQRGVGSALYGSASIGGTVNVNATQPHLAKEIKVTTGIGSYGTRKATIEFNSGLVAQSYDVYGRFSRLVSDGYREKSWTDQWAYFLGVARYDQGLVNRLQVYGGQEETHLSYLGISRERLETNRRYNPQEYDGEIDHFQQPHYELLTDWYLSDNWTFNNTLFYIKGVGYYDQLYQDAHFTDYQLTPFTTPGGQQIDQTDLVAHLFVENDFWGVVPRATYQKGGTRLSFGGEFNIHRGVNNGSISWAEVLPPDSVQDVGPEHRFYDYEGRRIATSAYVNVEQQWTPRITTMTALQYQFRQYELVNDHLLGINHQTPYHTISPRVGINVNLTQSLNVFGNIAYAQQEPAFDEIYSPAWDWYSPGDYFGSFNPETGEGDDPIMNQEKLLDFELGGGYRTSEYSAEVNLYWMQFEDEIVYNGGLNEIGVPIRVNAPSSVHRGFELAMKANPMHGLQLSGNMSYSDNYFEDFTEYSPDWSTWPPAVDTLSRDGNTIAGFPDLMTNLRGSYEYRGVTLGGHLFHAGRIYLDNSDRKERSVDPYTLVNASFSADLPVKAPWPRATITARVNNLFDSEYETAGYVDADGPKWIVGAERNVFVSLNLGF